MTVFNYIALSVFFSFILLSVSAKGEEDADLPVTGASSAELHSFDELILARLKEKNIAGASAAIVKDGRLIYARGFGYADREKKIPVEPTTLFRLASVSKPITAVAMMTVLQNKKQGLSLDTPVFAYLGLKPFTLPGHVEDPRIWKITIRNLLQHSGGWNRDKSGDIMFQHLQIAKEMGVSSPIKHESLIRWGMGRQLDFDAGKEYAYSNFGFCVLGRVIEKATGMTYEKYVLKSVLKPMDITQMRIGKGSREDRFKEETVYYASGNQMGESYVSADGGKQLPLAYAFQSPEVMDAHGGWIASAVDMARFAAKLNSPSNGILTVASERELYSRPAKPLGLESDGSPAPVFYGLGWQVRDLGAGNGVNVWHGGGMPGTNTILVRLSSGISWVLLFNGDGAGDIDGLMHAAASKVRNWPQNDLFKVKSK